MADTEITPTHSAFLALQEEKTGMQEGYRFLDEKRLILAAEMLEELGRYEEEMNAFRRRYDEAARMLQAAVARHGLEGLELYPRAVDSCPELQIESRSVLGVSLHTAALKTTGEPPPAAAVNASPEAEACRKAFVDLIPRAARLAALTGNLERLRKEYARTARRARALEDVLLPEIDDSLAIIDAALEDLEREEAVRVRRFRGES